MAIIADGLAWADGLCAADGRRSREAGVDIELRIERAVQPVLAVEPSEALAGAKVDELRPAPNPSRRGLGQVSDQAKPQRPVRSKASAQESTKAMTCSGSP